MSDTELFSMLRALSRREKLLVMQFLIAELIADETRAALEQNEEYVIHTPLESYATASALGELLEQQKETVIG